MKTKLEILADELNMDADYVRDVAKSIRYKRNDELMSSLMAKVKLIRERNAAILPSGEIVGRVTPNSMSYESP